MNYIKELNAFRAWKSVHDISTGAIALWYELIGINNMVGWKRQFKAPNTTVEQGTGLSKKGIMNARRELIAFELINYFPGKRGTAPIYEMISIVEKFNNEYCTTTVTQNEPLEKDQEFNPTQSEHQSSTQAPPHSSTNPGPIHKEKQKEKEKEKHPHHDAENAVTVYEENFGMLSPIARESLLEWCERMGDKMVIAAMKLAVKHNAHSFSYIEKILQDWHRARIETMEQLAAYQKQRELQKAKNKQDEKESLFKELAEEGW